jgi:uncharacterized tellurite resistance protein B-like protein
MRIDTAVTRRLLDGLLAAAHDEEPLARAAPGHPDSAGDLTAQQTASLERALPLIETMFLMMTADQDSAPEERDAVRGAINTLTGGSLGARILDSLLDRFEATLSEQGLESRLQQIGAGLALDREDSEGAFALAAAVAVADERIDAREDELVGQIAEWYGISPKRAEAILAEVSEGAPVGGE